MFMWSLGPLDMGSHKLGVLFWDPCIRDPVILGQYSVHLIFGSYHIGSWWT